MEKNYCACGCGEECLKSTTHPNRPVPKFRSGHNTRTQTDMNEIIVEGETAKIPIHNQDGQIMHYAIIDKEFVGLVKKYRWHYHKPNNGRGDGYALNTRIGRMEWFILGRCPLRGFVVDHINRSSLDNRVQNLRLVNLNINARNASIRSDNKSGVKGVSCSISSSTGKKTWYAQIEANHKKFSSKPCQSKREAIEERRKLENKYWGDDR